MKRYLLFLLVSLFLLPVAGQDKWGIVKVCCAHLRDKPGHSSEMVTEAIMGTPVKIIAQEGEWLQIITPDEYRSWVHPASVQLLKEEEIVQWRSSARYVYTGFQGFVYESPDESSYPVSDIVSGCIVGVRGKKVKGFFPVSLPDGRKGYVKQNEVKNMEEWASAAPNIMQMEDLARRMMGTTYLWGGTSVKGVDCSGLTRIVYFSSGLLLMRDASQQAVTGEKLPSTNWRDFRKGDLVFFSNKAGRVNHVGIYLSDGKFIHSAGRVQINSLDSVSPAYYSQKIHSASRMLTKVGTEGIVRVKEQPWYFNK